MELLQQNKCTNAATKMQERQVLKYPMLLMRSYMLFQNTFIFLWSKSTHPCTFQD